MGWLHLYRKYIIFPFRRKVQPQLEAAHISILAQRLFISNAGVVLNYSLFLSPVICYFVQDWLLNSFGYVMSFELLLLNALVTVIGLALIAKKEKVDETV